MRAAHNARALLAVRRSPVGGAVSGDRFAVDGTTCETSEAFDGLDAVVGSTRKLVVEVGICRGTNWVYVVSNCWLFERWRRVFIGGWIF